MASWKFSRHCHGGGRGALAHRQPPVDQLDRRGGPGAVGHQVVQPRPAGELQRVALEHGEGTAHVLGVVQHEPDDADPADHDRPRPFDGPCLQVGCQADEQPVLDHAPGSPERAALEVRLAELWGQRHDLPNWVDGKQVMGGGRRTTVTAPFEHRHVLGVLKNSTVADAQSAVDAAKRAAPGWRALSFDDRGSTGAGSGREGGPRGGDAGGSASSRFMLANICSAERPA